MNALNKFKLKSDRWGIYGHGAGAHFVHRYVLHHPADSHSLAIAANLGWYMSLTDQAWPFGLTNSEITKINRFDLVNRLRKGLTARGLSCGDGYSCVYGLEHMLLRSLFTNTRNAIDQTSLEHNLESEQTRKFYINTKGNI